MPEVFSNSGWIWHTDHPVPDSYGDFVEKFIYRGGKALCRISVDGDYTLFVNGKYAASCQYGDFEHYKIYDSIDITKLLHEGENELYILVWHMGIGTSRHRPAAAGLIFEVEAGGEIIAASGKATLCREDPNYKSNYCKMITRQLGQSFYYNATAEDIPFHASVETEKRCQLFPRPTKKANILPEMKMTILKDEGSHYLIDLHEETVGFPELRFHSDTGQKILVTWGEHIADGGVRRIIGDRDFSFEYVAKAGHNDYTNFMLRLGCRYLEVFCEDDIRLEYCGIIPQLYPTEKVERHFENALDQKIYELCVRTLELCMMEEHYVDTPWREQCFYSFDSRNQMLCGYRAFKGGNFDYARAALLLISKDDRPDGLLNITYPSGGILAIPSFSLHYFTAVREYLEATGDLSLGEAVYGKLLSIAEVFLKQMKDGLLWTFEDRSYWNFYDWSPFNDENIGSASTHPDLMINAMFIIALKNLKAVSQMLGRDFSFDELITELMKSTKKAFFVEEDGLFSMSRTEKQYSELGNSVAILAGIADEDESRVIAEKMLQGKTEECSLSAKCFKYDALLKVSENYRGAVLDEIRRTYKLMVDIGATSVWEVIEGESAFDDAGSLCHGWSSLPILYL